MSFTLKKTYQYFLLSKSLILLAQLIATFYLILWNIEFWEKVAPQLSVLFEHELVNNLDKAFNIILPSLISFGVFIICLLGLSILKKLILHIRVKPQNIVRFEKTGEIHPLFARLLVSHYKWHSSINLETFFALYKENEYLQKVLTHHQSNKDFYEFLCKYDETLSQDFPYATSTIIRREELLSKNKTDPT